MLESMSKVEFARAFPAESEFVERKKGASQKPLSESIVAFSNSDGGIILLGVDNDGTVVGRELTPGLEDDLHQAVGHIRDPGRYSIHGFHVDGTAVTALSVARRTEGFAQTSNGRVLVRGGSYDVPLCGSELREFLNGRSLERFEATETKIRLEECPAEVV